MSSDTKKDIPIRAFISGTVKRHAGTEREETIYCEESGLGVNRTMEYTEGYYMMDGSYMAMQSRNGAVDPVRFLSESFFTAISVTNSRNEKNLYISGADEYLLSYCPYYYGLYYYIKANKNGNLSYVEVTKYAKKLKNAYYYRQTW